LGVATEITRRFPPHVFQSRQGVWRDASSFVSIVEVFRIRVSELLIFVNEFR
jgi:hypothetical protein